MFFVDSIDKIVNLFGRSKYHKAFDTPLLIDLLSYHPLCVRDWSGILCEFFGSGIWVRGRDLGTGFGDVACRVNGMRDAGESEQRYSGKPDGFAGTPKIESEKLKI